jgi:hypothetical protein
MWWFAMPTTENTRPIHWAQPVTTPTPDGDAVTVTLGTVTTAGGGPAEVYQVLEPGGAVYAGSWIQTPSGTCSYDGHTTAAAVRRLAERLAAMWAATVRTEAAAGQDVTP